MSSPVSYLDPAQLRRDLGLRDLSEPAEGPHAIQALIGRAVEGLSRAWGCEVRWCRGPRIVPVADNYDRLGYAPEAVTRDTRYTRYVDAENMLRSHSSAMAPPALRRLADERIDDVLLVCPGIVYRRDAIDWRNRIPVGRMTVAGTPGNQGTGKYAVADGGDLLYRSLSWATCSTPLGCTTRTTCTSLPLPTA